MRVRILLVEDMEALCVALSALIMREGFECDCATSAADAKKVTETIRYQVAVIDGRLGDGSGVQLARELASAHRSMKFIIISGYSQAHLKLTTSKRLQFLPKPFRPEELIDCIKRAAGERAA